MLRLQRDAVLSDSQLVVKLLERLEQAPELSACCALVSDAGRVASSGGRFLEADGFLSFTLDDQGRPVTALVALEERRCDWLPPGATLWRRDADAAYRAGAELVPTLREQELGLRLRAARIEVGTCPTARVEWKPPLPAEDPVELLASLRRISGNMGWWSATTRCTGRSAGTSVTSVRPALASPGPADHPERRARPSSTQAAR